MRLFCRRAARTIYVNVGVNHVCCSASSGAAWAGHITVDNIEMGESPTWPELTDSLRRTCVRGVCHRPRARVNEPVCVWVMGCPRGQPRNGWCYHNMSFLSTLLCKGLLYVSIALCSALWLLPSPLCFSVAAFKGLRWITAFTRTDAVHCSGFFAFCATFRLPHWCALWLDSDGEEGWGVNYRLSTLRADTANTGKKYH